MGSAVIGALRVDLSLGTAGWDAGLKKIQGQALGLKGTFAKIGSGITTAGVALSAGITAPFTALMAKAIPAAKEADQAIGQVRAALEHMGPAAGRTEEQLKGAARELMHISTFDDDEILRKVTANLLTFGGVSGKVFDDAQLAIVNLSSRMGTDLQASTIMIGKALNVPEKGITSLRRVGIQFTQQQQDQIKAMVAVGNTAGAQAIMIKELNRQFGGSAKAMRDATPGADLKNSWDDFTETVGGFALKVLPPLTSGLAGVLDKFNALPAPLQSTIVTVAAIAAALGPVLMVLGPMVSLLGAAIPVVVGWGVAMGGAAVAAGGFIPLLVPLLPIIAAVGLAAGAAYLVWKNWATIGPILAAFGQAVAAALGPSVLGLINAVKEAASALWNSGLGAAIKDVSSTVLAFGKIILEALGAALPGVLKAVGALFREVFDGLAATIRLVVALLSGDWAGAWQQAKNLVQIFKTGVAGILSGLWGAVSGAVMALVRGIDDWLGGKLTATWNRLKVKIDEVTGWFRGMYDAVVGHSYVPDMVDGIERQMARLDAVLAEPAKKATKKAADAFKDLATEVQPLLDQLFPDERKWLEFHKNIDLLTRAGLGKNPLLSPSEVDQAKMRLITDATGGPAAVTLDTGPLDEMKGGIEDLIKTLPDLETKTKTTTAQMIEAFAGMARDVLGSLRGMVSAFKGGDILGGLSQLLDIVVQVAGLFKGGGVFAPRPSVNVTGGVSYGGTRALGGPTLPGRAYRVGERGQPEWFVPGERGRIVPSGGPGGGNVYHFQGNLLTPEFWAEIERRDQEAKLAGSVGGAALSMNRLQYRQRRSIYGSA